MLKTLLSINTRGDYGGLAPGEVGCSDYHIALDCISIRHNLSRMSGNLRTVVGPAANRNRSLKYFNEHKEFDAILILNQDCKVVRPGLFEKLELAIAEVKQPFMSIGHVPLTLEAAGEWVLYYKEANAAGLYLTREAFNQVGYLNNLPSYHKLYLQRLMRTYGFSPQFLPTFRYTNYFLQTPEYKEVTDPRFDKLAAEIWKGYELENWNPGLPKKGEY
jgi:hypothetical protein